MDFMNQRLVAMGTIEVADMQRFTLTDSPEEAAQTIRDTALQNFGLRYITRRPRRRRFLFE
jgi:predicted Rossmann-fold nucleotide-binding protein